MSGTGFAWATVGARFGTAGDTMGLPTGGESLRRPFRPPKRGEPVPPSGAMEEVL
jgi:hypothetical protein